MHRELAMFRLRRVIRADLGGDCADCLGFPRAKFFTRRCEESVSSRAAKRLGDRARTLPLCVEIVIDALGDRRRDALNLLKIADAGALDRGP